MTKFVLVSAPQFSPVLLLRWGSVFVLLALALATGCRSTPSGPPSASAEKASRTEVPAAPVGRKEVPLDKDVSLLIETRAFEERRHDVRLCGGVPCLIDGKPVYGAYGSLPAVEIVSLTLKTGNRKIPLDTSAMYNPWSPREDLDVHAWLSRELGGRLVIRGEFSDGAGAYFAEWEVVEGSAIRTVLKCAECLSMACQGFEAGSK